MVMGKISYRRSMEGIMHIRDILSSERILFLVTAHSKKKALEMVAETIAGSITQLQAHAIFDGLIARERLGSTSIGHGIAIPHARLEGLKKAVGAFMLLKEGINFDAEDNINVDMIFTLLVPENANDEHLALLATIAKNFSADKFRQNLRQASSKEELFQRLIHA